jgi:CheY-like chemotaxis protein
MKRKILIVEDEPNMSRGLKDNLEFEGYDVDVADNGAAGLKMILGNAYALIVMDVMMPEMSGLDVCKKVRDAGIAVPIIMLTAKSEEIDKIWGWNLAQTITSRNLSVCGNCWPELKPCFAGMQRCLAKKTSNVKLVSLP